jgi:hypothetical protein
MSFRCNALYLRSTQKLCKYAVIALFAEQKVVSANICDATFQVLMAANMKMAVFWEFSRVVW